MSMHTPLSFQDLAVLSTVLQKPLEKGPIARRALELARGGTFDETVALATVDRLVALGFLRKVGVRFEITTEGRVAASSSLQDFRDALAQMGRAVFPRLVEAPVPTRTGEHRVAG